MILIFVTIFTSLLTVTQSYQDCSTTKRLTDHYWSVEAQECLPCTRCHDQRLITLIGCAPDKDALCGTIEDLRHQWLLPSLRNGEDISPNFVAAADSRTMKTKKAVPQDEVYGRTRYSAPDSKYYDATAKVRDSVRNASQKKNEFLRKLQEIEQISVSKKVKQEADEVDGTVHFSEDEFFRHADADDLHQDLEIIEQELLRENEGSSSKPTASTMSSKQSIQTTTEEVSTPPPIPVWFNGNEGVLEAHDKSFITTTTDPSEDFIVGHQQFFAKSNDFADKGDVYGAVVQEPPAMDKSKLSGSADEFGLLKQILYKEPSTSPDVSYISVKLEHILVIVGFCIGFSLVFCVALVYYKSKPGLQQRRLSTLNNAVEVRAQDASSLSSGNSSFQQTDSRLTSLTASPLLSQAQSPCVLPRLGQTSRVTSPVINREDISPSVLNIPQSNRHSVYVDQRGRTSLGKSRELPV